VVVNGDDLADQFDYVALGHIHKPQALTAPHVRYSGSIERMDLGEQADQKGVVLVDLGPDGLRGEPVLLPLPATPVREITVHDPGLDIPQLRAEFPDATTDLVNLHIHYTAGRDVLEDVLADLDGIFPRWYARDWQEAGALGDSLAGAETGPARGFGETVRDYLAQELTNHAEAEREAILTLADDLLKEFEN